MRLNFSFLDKERMEPGIRLLAELVSLPQHILEGD